MPYIEEFHPQIKRDLKILDKSLAKNIFLHFDKILENPFLYKQLINYKPPVYSYKFFHNNTNYRIAFRVINNTVRFLKITTRQNFYDDLSNRL